jgi:hypothetical protein
MGRKIKTLPANAFVNWKDGKGIYIVRFVGERFLQKKIIILKGLTTNSIYFTQLRHRIKILHIFTDKSNPVVHRYHPFPWQKRLLDRDSYASILLPMYPDCTGVFF